MEFCNNKISVKKKKNILIKNVDPTKSFFKKQGWHVQSVRVYVRSLRRRNGTCTSLEYRLVLYDVHRVRVSVRFYDVHRVRMSVRSL
jgi:hypothetical protein